MICSQLRMWPSTLDYTGRIDGRSWEMAAMMHAAGHSGAFTGEVASFDDHGDCVTVHFGPVAGVDLKRSKIKDLRDYSQIPSVTILLPRP
jgi:hypothetical protein